MEDEINLGSVGKGMPHKSNFLRSGAGPPKHVSGSTGTDSSSDLRPNSCKVGSGCCIAEVSCFNAVPSMPLIEICDMRSWPCSNAAMMLCTLFSSTLYQLIRLIGKDGQISSDVLVGVLSVQITRRSRRRGDPKITHLHLRHTCVRDFHLQPYIKPLPE